MSKHKGVNRYTDKATGRPVIDVPKEMIGAWAGKTPSRTANRAVSRWHQGSHGAGKGDMPRPGNKRNIDESWLRMFCTFYTDGDLSCECIECRNGSTRRN